MSNAKSLAQPMTSPKPVTTAAQAKELTSHFFEVM